MSEQIVLTAKALDKARELLLNTLDILDRNGVIYHLEGGTLLGIVRDGDLLPWDHDMDISIPSNQVESFMKCLPFISSLKWKVRDNCRFNTTHAAWNNASQRMFKIKDRKFVFFTGRFCFDVFVKYEYENFIFWEAKKKIMRVEKRFYETYEEVDYYGRKVKVPNHYRDYLTAKYGDWSVPVKEWDCAVQELTIIR